MPLLDGMWQRGYFCVTSAFTRNTAARTAAEVLKGQSFVVLVSGSAGAAEITMVARPWARVRHVPGHGWGIREHFAVVIWGQTTA